MLSMSDWHRAAAALAAQGMSQTEISFELDRPLNEICNLYKNKVFTDLISEKLRNSGKITQFLNGMVVDSLMAVITIRDNKESPPAVRLAAANTLLDRALGKASNTVRQITTTETESAVNPKEEIARLELEIKREQEKQAV
jgi:hypothetical protein